MIMLCICISGFLAGISVGARFVCMLNLALKSGSVIYILLEISD